MAAAVPLADRRYLQTAEPDPRDRAGVGRRRRLQEPREVRVLALAVACTSGPYPPGGTLDTSACGTCGALDVRPIGPGEPLIDRGDYLLGDEGYCGACGGDRFAAFYTGFSSRWVDSITGYTHLDLGPRNALVEDLATGARYVRPFRGLRRRA
jgi:hypothetical protein